MGAIKIAACDDEKEPFGKQGSMHGIGLSNVKREAEKYMGDIDTKIKKSEFSVTVMLQERRQVWALVM